MIEEPVIFVVFDGCSALVEIPLVTRTIIKKSFSLFYNIYTSI